MRRLVLGIAVAVTSLMPVVGMADDQKIADFIKSRLQAEQQQGNLQGFNVDMRVEQGTVWFKGHVSNSNQELTILKTAQAAAHLGVLQVVDDIEVATAQTEYASQAIPAEAPQLPTRQVAYQQRQRRIPARSASFSPATPPAPVSYSLGSAVGNEPIPYAATAPCQGPDCGYAAPIEYGSSFGAPIEYGGGGTPLSINGPVGSGFGGQVGGNNSPSLPGYAWPSYAAHPNFGNVSYPQQYSPAAWPYIGPFYPYPQVPLGWRKVTLEWDDGFWQLDFHDK